MGDILFIPKEVSEIYEFNSTLGIDALFECRYNNSVYEVCCKNITCVQKDGQLYTEYTAFVFGLDVMSEESLKIEDKIQQDFRGYMKNIFEELFTKGLHGSNE